jgi:hypothetical protein
LGKNISIKVEIILERHVTRGKGHGRKKREGRQLKRKIIDRVSNSLPAGRNDTQTTIRVTISGHPYAID